VTGVPRVWEKISEKMRAIGASVEGLKKTIATWAKAKGLEHAVACQVGGDGSYPSMYGLADSIVLSKVKENLGPSETLRLLKLRDAAEF
jgi:long-chain-fatty-acid--CoA ligase ACSBG